jgi:hypothetical protein
VLWGKIARHAALGQRDGKVDAAFVASASLIRQIFTAKPLFEHPDAQPGPAGRTRGQTGTQDAHAAQTHAPVADAWRAPAAGRALAPAAAAYRYANLASHHVLGFTVKAVLLAYFSLHAAVPGAALGGPAEHRPVQARHRTRRQPRARQPGHDRRVYASWRGLHPNLYLGDVRLRDREGRQLLLLPSVSATLSWWSVAAAEPRFDSLEINRPELDMRRTPDGVFWVAGVRIDPNRKEEGSGGGADWLLRQREIVIREGRLSWTDELRAAPVLALSDVTMVLQNRWTTHRFALKRHAAGRQGRIRSTCAPLRPSGLRRRASDPSALERRAVCRPAQYRPGQLEAVRRLSLPLHAAAARCAPGSRFDQARLAGFTADLAWPDVSARLAPDAAAAGAGAVRPPVGARGDQARRATTASRPSAPRPQHRPENFSVVTSDGVVLPPATLSETWRPAARGKPERFEVHAARSTWRAGQLAAQMPLAPQQRQLLADWRRAAACSTPTASGAGRYPRATWPAGACAARSKDSACRRRGRHGSVPAIARLRAT